MVTVKGEVATVKAAVAMVTEGVAGNERLSEAQSLTASGSYVETLETAHRDQQERSQIARYPPCRSKLKNPPPASKSR